jgi:hypothetical protein
LAFITGRWWAPVAGRADLDVLVPAWFACRQLGVTKQTFGHWVRTGKVTPVAPGEDGHPRYRYGDVLEAERQTRRSPNSRRGARARCTLAAT